MKILGLVFTDVLHTGFDLPYDVESAIDVSRRVANTFNLALFDDQLNLM